MPYSEGGDGKRAATSAAAGSESGCHGCWPAAGATTATIAVKHKKLRFIVLPRSLSPGCRFTDCPWSEIEQIPVVNARDFGAETPRHRSSGRSGPAVDHGDPDSARSCLRAANWL